MAYNDISGSSYNDHPFYSEPSWLVQCQFHHSKILKGSLQVDLSLLKSIIVLLKFLLKFFWVWRTQPTGHENRRQRAHKPAEWGSKFGAVNPIFHFCFSPTRITRESNRRSPTPQRRAHAAGPMPVGNFSLISFLNYNNNCNHIQT